MYVFGSGYVFTKQTYDASGNALANGPRIILGTNQDISFDMGFTVKELYGQNQWAEDVARGAMKMGGKVKFAQIYGAAWDSLFFGQPNNLTAGTLTSLVAAISATLIPATPFIITPTPPLSGTFVADICVINASTGIPMIPVTGTPTAGQYSVTAGAYTFSSADHSSGYSVLINYEYTATVTAAYSQTVASLPMGSTPYFSLSHTVQHLGKNLTLLFPRCTTSKMSLALKNEDFLVPELDWQAMRDPVTNSVMTWSTSE